MLRRLISRVRPSVVGLASACLLIPLSTGCYSGEDFPLGRSFIDPTELGRYPEQTLVVPIVRTLDAVAEGPDRNFVTARDVRPADLEYQPVDYTLVPNDIVQVTITGLFGPGVESVRPAQAVSRSGKIPLPYVGEVAVAGLTEAQAAQAISAAYRDSGMMADAPVTVSVLQGYGNTFSVNGAVGRPGRFVIETSDFRLLDALVLSGNVTSEVGIDYVYIIRRIDDTAANGPAPEATPTQPAPQPGANDPLAPGSALPKSMQPAPVYLQDVPATEPAAPVAPADAPAADAPATTPPAVEGRTVIIDGKEVPLGSGPTPVIIEAAPGTTLTVEQTPAVDATQQTPFEFDAPQEPTNREVIRVPLPALKRGELRFNVVIEPGDYLYVPPPVVGEYYMAGHVNRPGAYSLTAREIRLTDALISAGGLDPIAWPDRCSIRRKISADKAIIVRVNLARVVDGLDPDIYLKPDDQVYVGTNFVAPFIAAIRNGFRVTYGFGFIYDKNFADDNNDFSF